MVRTTSKSVPKVAKELGISHAALYNWLEVFNKSETPEFPGIGNPSTEKKEIIELKKQLTAAREEAKTLKKEIDNLFEELI